MGERLVEVSVNELTPGIILGASIPLHSDSNAAYRHKGHSLSEADISWLKNKGFKKISIVKELGLLESILNESLPEIFSQKEKSNYIFTPEVEIEVKKCLRRIELDDILSLKPLEGLINEKYSHNTYFHVLDIMSLNVALSKYMGWCDDDVFIATKCGLFHDLGKYDEKVAEVISSENGLTMEQREIMQTHCQIGFDYIKGMWPKETEVMQVAGGHHLYYDSFGNLKGYGHSSISSLSKFSLLTRVSDVYGALTSPRWQGKLMGHDEAIKLMGKIHSKTPFDEFILKKLFALGRGELPKFLPQDKFK